MAAEVSGLADGAARCRCRDNGPVVLTPRRDPAWCTGARLAVGNGTDDALDVGAGR